MDFDFILTSIVYLATILFIHITLKNKDSVVTSDDSLESSKLKPVIVSDSDNKSSDTSSIMTQEDNLIINANELDSINNDTNNNEFIKYLDVEGIESDTDKNQLVSPLQDNTIDVTSNDSKNDLDKYFTNVKDEQYSFDPVPTSKKVDKEFKDSTKLYSDTEPLNVNSSDKHIMPFDDFGELYAPI